MINCNKLLRWTFLLPKTYFISINLVFCVFFGTLLFANKTVFAKKQQSFNADAIESRLRIEDATNDKKERKILYDYKKRELEWLKKKISSPEKAAWLSKTFSGSEKYGKISEPLDEDFEWIYLGNYKIALPMEGILSGRNLDCYGKILYVDYLNYKIRIIETALDSEVKDYTSYLYDSLDSLKNETKQKLINDIRKRAVWQSDYAFCKKMWSEDFTQKELEGLTLNDIEVLNMLAYYKFGDRDPERESEIDIKEIQTCFMRGIIYLHGSKRVGVHLADNKRNLQLEFELISPEKKNRLDEGTVEKCISSVQPIVSKNPAMDMVLKAEEYLRDTSKPTSSIAFMFLNTAKQYSAYDTKQMEKRIELVSKAVQKDLIKDLNSVDPNIRSTCIAILATYQNSDSVQATMKMLKDKSPKVRIRALYALGGLGKTSPKIYLMMENDKSFGVRKVNVDLLDETNYYDDKDRIRFSLKALNDPHPEVRKEAVKNLYGYSEDESEEVLSALKKLRNDPNEKVRESVEEAIFDIIINDDDMNLNDILKEIESPSKP